MQCLNTATAIATIVLLLSACNSNTPSSNVTPSKVTQKKQNIDSSSTTENNTVKTVTNSSNPMVPADGKLRPEHLRMYVAVKIKQEQLRFDHAVKLTGENSQFSKTTRSSSKTLTVSAFEKAAISHFEFDDQLFYWTKKAIENTLQAYTDLNLDLQNPAFNPENSAVIHNLSLIKKFADELNFADRYRLGTDALVAVSHPAYRSLPASSLTSDPNLTN